MTNLNLYNNVKNHMKTGDILQWHSYSFVGKAIRWKTSKKGDIKRDVPNHSSMIIRLSEWEGIERRRYHTEAMNRGVYPNVLSRRLENFKGRVWWLPLKAEWDSKREEVGLRLLDVWGTPYDYKSLVWQLIGKVSVDIRQLFCSEVIDFALFGKTEKQAHNPRDVENLGAHRDKIFIFDSNY